MMLIESSSTPWIDAGIITSAGRGWSRIIFRLFFNVNGALILVDETLLDEVWVFEYALQLLLKWRSSGAVFLDILIINRILTAHNFSWSTSVGIWLKRFVIVIKRALGLLYLGLFLSIFNGRGTLFLLLGMRFMLAGFIFVLVFSFLVVVILLFVIYKNNFYLENLF